MLEVLHFVFSGFWVWAGTVVLVCAVSFGVLAGLAAGVSAVRR